jgi:putative PIN family toxin of toxin-antitoxin system
VVLDTNIYVSAFNGRRRRNFKIWQAAVQGRFHILVSPAIVNELARVLRDGFQWQEPQVQQMLRTIVKVAEVVSPQKRLSEVVRDPDDNHILECAAGRQGGSHRIERSRPS